MLDTVIVGLIIFLAGWYVFHRIRKMRHDDIDCGSGCAGCSQASNCGVDLKDFRTPDK